MPLQNRVQPDGQIIAHPARGMFTGNRGILHDWHTKTLVRQWTSKAWIICLCEFRGHKREVMSKGTWTELFFLDEVTALAAGHRPCFYCQRERAKEFQQHWREVTGKSAKAPEMDAVLHRQRVLSGKTPHNNIRISELPEGTFGTSGSAFYARNGGKVIQWSFTGYKFSKHNRLPEILTKVTPELTAQIIANGFQPVWHKSANRI